MPIAKLYIVATPIGNLKDITLRALEVLRSVALIACEDTKHSKKLLNFYGINTELISYNDINKKRKTPLLLAKIKEGQDIALISDAGTPGISDPGYYLIREAIKNEIEVIAIPGPSALISALVVSGLATDRFVFEGFLPRQRGKRQRRLEALRKEERTIILFASPYRIIKILVEVLNILGNRKVCVVREQTKFYEEILRGEISVIIDELNKRERLRGEFVVIIEGRKKISA